MNFKEYLYNSESRKTLSILKTRFTPRALNINTEWKSKSVFPNSENRSGESPNSLNIISIWLLSSLVNNVLADLVILNSRANIFFHSFS